MSAADLIESGDAEELEMMYHGHKQRRLIAKRRARLDAMFSAEDIAIVDLVIDELWPYNASEISELSHGITWKVAKTQQRIPYQSVFVTNRAPTKDDLDWAAGIVEAERSA